MNGRLFIVFLRRPGKGDGRTDPFWEFGSFGCTGCHDDNLLHPGKKHIVSGDRVAFVQGGGQGCKLLLITPPVKRVEHGQAKIEIRWNRAFKPFRYYSELAPVLARPGGTNIALPELGRIVNKTRRTTAQAKLASCFRTRCEPLGSTGAAELQQLFRLACEKARPTDFISNYTDALPWSDVRLSLAQRSREYRSRLAQLDSTTAPAHRVNRHSEAPRRRDCSK